MSNTTASLRSKIGTAGDLRSVVRTMKALAASSIGQFEQSVRALADYYRTVELGLSVCLRKRESTPPSAKQQERDDSGPIGAFVFGSDQGLIGGFNDEIADYAIRTLAKLGGSAEVWAIGSRVHARLADARIPLLGLFSVPTSVKAIAPLVGEIQLASEAHRAKGDYSRVYVFHNRPQPGALYEPVSQRLLPLDAVWREGLVKVPWPTKSVPEIMCGGAATLRALIREYLFISLFRACAESLASENACRLAAMQRADKSIDELLEILHVEFHRVRQGGIDEELFDVVSGFEALDRPQKNRGTSRRDQDREEPRVESVVGG